MADLAKRKCVPCEGGVARLTRDRIETLLGRLKGDWRPVERGRKLTRQFTFRDFKSAIRFIEAMAEIAEAEQHHPDFCLHDYKLLDVTLSTHAIEGLSENDFILAAKIDKLPGPETVTATRSGR
jgi:4a-hydroxytetrahydrobiopterin dehydratase